MASHDLLVLGAGPGGYVAAIRGAQLGLNVGCVEKEAALGGTCLRVGCIPSKAMLESSEKFAETRSKLAEHGIRVSGVELDLAAMLGRKDKVVQSLTQGVEGLLKKNKITRYLGHARIVGLGKVAVESQGRTQEIEAERVLIATGSRSASLRGIELDGKHIVTSTEALSFEQVPGHLVVVGGGYIGLELGCVWQRLGSKVTVLEYLDRILPGTDGQIAELAQKLLSRQGLEFRVGVRVTGAKVEGQGCVVECQGSEPIRCDRVLVAVGRRPNTEGLGLASVGIEQDKVGRIVVDEQFRTTAAGFYAIGDVIAGPMLAHKASEEGVACVERMMTGYGHVNYDAIPGVCYTHPEIASVGKTEEQLREQGVEYRKGVFQFRGIGRARAMGEIDGLVKILAARETDRVLGVHILGPSAGELIHEAVAAMEFGASSEDVARLCHAHPTLSEAVKEGALAVDGKAIHGG